MKRHEFEHVIAAAANIVGLDEFVVVGSPAVLATAAEIPAEMLVSMEADVYPLHHPEEAVRVDGALGGGSQFHRTFGHYAHGVGPETAKLPRGWVELCLRVPIPPRVGSERRPVAVCPEIHDLPVSESVQIRVTDSIQTL